MAAWGPRAPIGWSRQEHGLRSQDTTTSLFFPYAFDRATKPLLRVIGVRPDRDGVRVEDQRLIASFGLLNASIDLANIESASVTGPYTAIKALGPRLSAADHGVTFGTTAAGGVCLIFVEPIPAIFGPWAHPGMTLTVAEPAGLVAAVRGEA